MRYVLAFLALAGMGAIGVRQAAATTAEVRAARDNTLYEDPAGARSNGAGAHFFAGRVGLNDPFPLRRGLIMFDVAGALPPGAQIGSVTLTLHMSRTISGAQDVSLHEVLADWGEGASNASGNEGNGAPAQPGDATWLHTSSPGGFWASPGGDFDPSPVASTSVAGAGFYTWGSTPAMVAAVQAWMDDPASNHGWLVMGNEAAAFAAKRFDSRESCPTDVNDDGVTDVLDLLEVLSNWGPCAGCPADVNGDDVVDVLDLLEVLTAWGPCTTPVLTVEFTS